MPRNNDDIVTFLITDHIADLQEKNNGWMKELNLVRWNGNKTPKFDIRDWSRDHLRMSRGLTFTEFEFERMIQEYLAWRSDAVVKQKRAERLAADQESRRQREMRMPTPDPIPPADSIPPDAPVPPGEPAATEVPVSCEESSLAEATRAAEDPAPADSSGPGEESSNQPEEVPRDNSINTVASDPSDRPEDPYAERLA